MLGIKGNTKVWFIPHVTDMRLGKYRLLQIVRQKGFDRYNGDIYLFMSGNRARYVQRMQKAMVQMNLMLVNVVDDITSNTGMAILENILKGERNLEVLAAHRRCKSSVTEITESLNGCYKSD